jgi:hypothetical protein
MESIHFKFSVVEKSLVQSIFSTEKKSYYLIITLSDMSIFEVRLTELYLKHLDKCDQFIDTFYSTTISGKRVCENIYVPICFPDYMVQYYIGIVFENNEQFFVLCEMFHNEDTSFKLKIPIIMCDKNSLTDSMKKFKELINEHAYDRVGITDDDNLDSVDDVDNTCTTVYFNKKVFQSKKY